MELVVLGFLLCLLLMWLASKTTVPGAPERSELASVSAPDGPAEGSEAEPADEPELPWRTTARVRMHYTDAYGGTSERVVDVQQFSNSRHRALFAGHCHLRRARRTFAIDRVAFSCDAATGDVIDDLWAHFAAASPDRTATPQRAQGGPLDSVADAVRLLVFVGKADGRLMAAERTVILRACNSLIQGPPWASDDEVARALQQYGIPTKDQFAELTQRVASGNPEAFRICVEAAREIIATQKTVHAAERAALALLESALGR